MMKNKRLTIGNVIVTAKFYYMPKFVPSFAVFTPLKQKKVLSLKNAIKYKISKLSFHGSGPVESNRLSYAHRQT